MPGDHIQVVYTTDDDGIHVWCAVCGWDEVVGFMPSVAEVIDAGARHPKLECKSPSTTG